MDSLSVEKARELSPLTLAFYGDSVYETLIRRKIVEKGSAPSHKLHAQSVAMARAGFQARAAEFIQPMLNEQEADILRRGRNASGATVPRSSNPKDYRLATALEALFGFLSLCLFLKLSALFGGKALFLKSLLLLFLRRPLSGESFFLKLS